MPTHVTHEQTRPHLSAEETHLFGNHAPHLFWDARTRCPADCGAPEPRVYREHQQIITIGGLPALNEVMEFDRDLFWRLKSDLDRFPVSGFNVDFEIDFQVTTHSHFRSQPIRQKKDRFRIVTIGDSCTFGVGVDDNQTWPAQKMISQRGHEVEVINAGVPGYTAFQGKRFLEKTGMALDPDLIVCCFGFNDGDTWASRSDFETSRSLRWIRGNSLMIHSRLYFSLQKVLQHDWAGEVGIDIAERPRLTPREFYTTLREIGQLCDERNTRLVLLVWPSASQVAYRVAQLVPYQQFTVQLGQNEGIPVVNLLPAFFAQPEQLFVDHIHANTAGCRVTAAALCDVVVPMLMP
ncbi:MAG: hypothetical protein IID46_08825 [Planctomycetes bacterium]|nr:hypothetical protein [Planctomycetota bacterium]